MDRINWCKKQSKGMRLTEPNKNLSEDYFNSAEESMKVLTAIHKTQSNIWLATTKYYIEYFATYAVLMKLGIKCEIHECTIEIARLLEKENILPKNTAETLENDKQLRIDNQYYLKNRAVELKPEELSRFLLTIRQSLDQLSPEKTAAIRKRLERC